MLEQENNDQRYCTGTTTYKLKKEKKDQIICAMMKVRITVVTTCNNENFRICSVEATRLIIITKFLLYAAL